MTAPAESGSVALDVSAVPPSPAGAGRYIWELAHALAARGDLALTVVTTRDGTQRWASLGPGTRVLPLVPAPRPLRLVYERTLLGPRIERLAGGPIEVYHGPHYTMPATVRVGRVVTVHDVTFLTHPEWHERAKVPFFRSAIRRAARHADVVVCVSHTTADHLCRLLQVRAEVMVAEHGIDHDRFCPGPVDAAAIGEELAGRDIVFFVGTLEPRKGVVDLVRAFDAIAGEKASLELVLAGQPGWGAGEVETAVGKSAHRDRIRLLGFVEDSTVVAFMRAARVFVYPSHEEGFGLPVLEAMAVGAPLVTTSGTAMWELARETAWPAMAGDPRTLAQALGQALRASPEETGRRRARAMAKAAEFTWERAAAVHVDAYTRAAELSAKRRRDR